MTGETLSTSVDCIWGNDDSGSSPLRQLMRRVTVPLCTAGVALLAALVCSMSGRCIIGTKHNQRCQLWRSNLTVITVVAAYVLLPSLAGAIAAALACHDFGTAGQYMATYSLDVECGSSQHTEAIAVAVLVLVTAVVAPFAFIALLLRHVWKLQTEHAAEQEDELDWAHEELKLSAFLAKSFEKELCFWVITPDTYTHAHTH